jgi:NAD(P)-dependent dehydrogenase (short-subunit alcohol dehydrogenase family)
MSGRLTGKVVLLTGGTIGIGRATAVALAREGARVVLTGRNEVEGAASVEEVEAVGGEARFLPQDITDEARWEAVVAQTEAAFGGLDVLVNNAGAFMVKPLLETSVDDFDWIYRVNVEGPFLGMKHALPAMLGRGGGSVVNVSSLLGKIGFPGGTAYCASKGALTALSQATAKEWADRRVRVNVIHPGVIWTKMVRDGMGDDDAVKQFLADETPLGRVGVPDDIAGAIVYLASDAASFVTGADFTIDGGRGAD